MKQKDIQGQVSNAIAEAFMALLFAGLAIFGVMLAVIGVVIYMVTRT